MGRGFYADARCLANLPESRGYVGCGQHRGACTSFRCKLAAPQRPLSRIFRKLARNARQTLKIQQLDRTVIVAWILLAMISMGDLSSALGRWFRPRHREQD